MWAAFILNQTTLIPTDSWVEEDSLAVVAARGNTDDYCNFAILIFARIINLLNASGDSSSVELRKGTGIMERTSAVETLASTEREASDEGGC